MRSYEYDRSNDDEIRTVCYFFDLCSRTWLHCPPRGKTMKNDMKQKEDLDTDLCSAVSRQCRHCFSSPLCYIHCSIHPCDFVSCVLYSTRGSVKYAPSFLSFSFPENDRLPSLTEFNHTFTTNTSPRQTRHHEKSAARIRRTCKRKTLLTPFTAYKRSLLQRRNERLNFLLHTTNTHTRNHSPDRTSNKHSTNQQT